MTLRWRPGLFAVTLMALLALVSLGVWQLQRRAWKLDLTARTEARLAAAPMPFAEALARALAGEDMEYQPVEAAGVYDHAREARVFATYEGQAGVMVFTPLATPQGELYVNRGFAPQAVREPGARAPGAPVGAVRVAGLFRGAERRTFFETLVAPPDAPETGLYYVRDPGRFAGDRAILTDRYYIDSFGTESAGPWPRGGLTRVTFPNRHLEYALTWFGLAGALLCVAAGFSVSRRP